MTRKNVLMALDWYDPALHKGIAEYARTRNWVLNTHMARTRQIPRGWMGDGILALVDLDSTADFIKSLRLPIIDIGGHRTEFPQILADNHRTGVLAAEYFLEKNYKNFAFLHVQSSRLEKEISSGFALTLEASGHTCLMRHWKLSQSEIMIDYQGVQEWAVEELQNLPKPVALMCQNDDTAAIIVNAVYDAGLRIPEEVAIMGAGNNDMVCEFLPRTLSSIDPNLRRLGFEAARELDRLMSGGRPRRATQRVPPKDVVTRESTDFLGVSNPHVLKVLRTIWDSYKDPSINIEAIIDIVPISRASLYSLFQQEVGRPMGQELLRIRIEHAKEMLRGTRLPINQIAKACGFSSLINFSRGFSQKVGLSPRDYRKKLRMDETENGAPSGIS